MSQSFDIVLNDPGTLIATPPSETLLPLPTEKQDANFELGVSMVIYGWHTLQTAVDNQWGGAQSAEKRDWITGLVIDAFNENKEIDIIYIHELLSNAMEDEFDAVIEDESTIQVGQKVIQVYKECLEGNFENVKAAYNIWLSKEKNRKKIIVTVTEDALNPNVSDSDNDSDEDGDIDMMEVEEEYIEPTKIEPVVDDDGFTVVTRKGRH